MLHRDCDRRGLRIRGGAVNRPLAGDLRGHVAANRSGYGAAIGSGRGNSVVENVTVVDGEITAVATIAAAIQRTKWTNPLPDLDIHVKTSS
jgi:hypothetical protein